MKITIKAHMAEAIGQRKFEVFGVKKEAWGWRQNGVDIDLSSLTAGRIDHLEGLLAGQAGVQGVKVLLKDIHTWKAAIKDASGLKARTVRGFEPILEQYLLKVPGHRVYAKSDHDPELWEAYYVKRVCYNPPNERSGTPAEVEMVLLWEEFAGKHSYTVDFRDTDIRGRNVVQALAHKGYYAETPELRATYEADLARFAVLHPQVGGQFLCRGFGDDGDVDGNRKERRDNSWWYSRSHRLAMVRNGEPSRVVVDLFHEDEDDRRQKAEHADPYFWIRVAKGRRTSADDDDENEWEDDIDLASEDPNQAVEIPIHPYLAVFDLAKHLRLKVHVGQLAEYRYDAHLADKLVLSEDRKALVRLLIDSKGGAFQDIVKGKGGGAVVLLAGPPGTGKTLTAEVYAESEGRALYSVQCSQLGTDPDSLEDELLKVFARAKRWNAVMLLDEADVYVHERGNDMAQNAIVGVFLRVLEYQDSVLFLTTNRPDDVDDAIASRCIARLTYPVPTPEQQKRIWQVLVAGAGAKMAEDQIDLVVAANGHLSGRDVKNLLKLGKVMMPDGITAEAVEFVKQFKPTGDTKDPAAVALPGGISRCPKCGVLIGKKGHVCPKGA